MNAEDLLEASLLDLLYELRDTNLALILAGGYGLYRKRQYVLQTGAPLMMQRVPPARSTNDLDVFLRTEVLANSEQAKLLREALDRLEYRVIKGAENYQFVRAIPIVGALARSKLTFLHGNPILRSIPTSSTMSAVFAQTLPLTSMRIRPRRRWLLRKIRFRL